MLFSIRSFGVLLATVFALSATSGCARLDPPEREGMLVVGVLPEPVFNFSDGTPATGFTKELILLFSKELNIPVRFIAANDAEELINLVRRGRVHMAAQLDAKPGDSELVFSEPLSETPLWVVQHVDGVGPRSIADLAGLEISTPIGSAAAAALHGLIMDIRPVIVEVRKNSEMDILNQLAAREITLAAVDQLSMRVAASTQPDLQPAVRLPGSRVFKWAFPAAGDQTLRQRANEFIADAKQDRSLARLQDRYFGHIQRLDPEGTQRFISAARTVLPRYRQEFQQAQELTGLDWRLLAALAYQESKWDPSATSYTNVRGMMMLTEDTADALGIENRLNAAQSIRGGSIYLLNLIEQLPDTIEKHDRLWFALAAYNLGMGHLNGGRAIAKGLDKDPDSWYDMKQVLPLLSQPKYYDRLKSGRARGGEAVILVDNVHSFFDILIRIEAPYVSPLSQIKKKPGKMRKLTQPATSIRAVPPK